jgi:hypothetical protein
MIYFAVQLSFPQVAWQPKTLPILIELPLYSVKGNRHVPEI